MWFLKDEEPEEENEVDKLIERAVNVLVQIAEDKNVAQTTRIAAAQILLDTFL